MVRIGNILWWIVFICSGIVIQTYMPHLDALVVGLLIAMQEKDWRTLAWLLPLSIVLQEGMGTQDFGASVLWFASFFIMYRLWQSISTASVFLFVLAVSLGLGGMRFCLDWLFCTLQGYPFSSITAVNNGIQQAIYTPIAWLVLTKLRIPVKHETHQEQE